MDPGAYQVFFSGHAKPPVPGAGRQQDCCGTGLIARLGGNQFVIAVGLDLNHGLGRGYLHFEPLGMGFHLVEQFAAVDSFNEAGVVVNALSGAGLLDDQSLDPFSGGMQAVVSPTGPLPTITKS